MCTYISQLLDYSFNITLIPMRNLEDWASATMQTELDKLATEDETTQYILAGVCLGLVIVSAIMVIPIFMKVIRNKSYVFAIFAHVTPDEVQQVIKECRQLDIKRIRFKKDWLTKFADREELFWKKVLAGNVSSTQRKLAGKKTKQDGLVSSGLLGHSAKSAAGAGEENKSENQAAAGQGEEIPGSESESKQEDEEEEDSQPEQKLETKPGEADADKKAAERARKRQELLSEIESVQLL